MDSDSFCRLLFINYEIVSETNEAVTALLNLDRKFERPVFTSETKALVKQYIGVDFVTSPIKSIDFQQQSCY